MWPTSSVECCSQPNRFQFGRSTILPLTMVQSTIVWFSSNGLLCPVDVLRLRELPSEQFGAFITIDQVTASTFTFLPNSC